MFKGQADLKNRSSLFAVILVVLTLIAPGIASAGKVYSSDQQITTNTNDQNQPAVAYAVANDEYLVVWTDYRNADSSCGAGLCGSDIYGRMCQIGQTELDCAQQSPAFVISDAPGNQAQPRVAYDIYNQKYLVAWTDSRNGTYSQIYGQFVDTSGNLLQTDGSFGSDNFMISNHSVDDVSQYQSDLVYDSVIDRFVTAWVDQSDYNTQQIITIQPPGCGNSTQYAYGPLPYVDLHVIRTAEVDPSDGSVGNVKVQTPLVALGPTVYGTSTFTQKWSSEWDMSDPRLVIDSQTGDYMLARSGASHVLTLSGTFSASNKDTLSISPSDYGDSVWAVDTPYTVNGNGSTISAVEVLMSDGSTSAETYTISGIGTASVQITFPSGATPPSPAIGTNEQLIVVLTYSGAGICTYNSAQFSDAVVDSVPKIKISREYDVGGLGLVIGLSFGTNQSLHPAISVDPDTDMALLAWEENTGGTDAQDIYGQMVDLSNMTAYGSTIDISSGTGARTSPAASYDDVNQRFLVAWEDARNQSANISNMDIYGQFIDPQGNLSGGNTPVTVAPGNQLSPAIAFGDTDKEFLVVWSDGRLLDTQPYNSDIYGQVMQYSQLPQLLIEDSSGNPILNGALDFGNVDVGQTEDLAIKLCNNGNAQLTINSMSLPDAPYSFLTPVPNTISPGTCYDMTAEFAPTAAGSYAGTPANNFKTVIDSTGGSTTLYFSGNGIGIEPLSITTTSLPDASTSTPYSATLSAYGGVYPYTWSSGTLPAGLALDAATGKITGTPTVSGSYDVDFTVTDYAGKAATRTLTINISVISITTTSLKQWTQGVEYGNPPPQSLAATGGTPPYSWSVSAGTLPPGMTLDPTTGALSGIPTSSGAFTFTAMVQDSAVSPQSVTKDLTITINPTPVVLTSSLDTGVVGAPYNQTVQMTGGTPPLTWSVSGALPPGLSFNSGTGVVSGTPASSGSYSFTVNVVDVTGATASKQLSININDTLGISTPGGALNDGAVGTSYSFTLAAAGGTIPYVWSITGNGVLPPGLALASATGIISGTPNTLGTYVFVVEVADADGRTATKTFSITVSSPNPEIQVTPTELDFPPTPVGSTSKASVTISSVGNVDLEINSVSFPSTPFSIVSNTCNTTSLPSGTSCTITLAFNPTFEGTFAPYYFTISSNDPVSPTVSVTLSGATGQAQGSKLGVFRAGAWYLDLNGNNQWDGCGTDGCYYFGQAGDIGVVGDWNGDGTDKVGVFRNGNWYLDYNGNGIWDSGDSEASFGEAGDIPVVGDWNGDGTDKVGVFRNGNWYLDYNGNGKWDGCSVDLCYTFGLSSDIPVAGDWDGTGYDKIGVYRDGVWYLDMNGDGTWNSGDLTAVFGMAGDVPVIGDWNDSGSSKIGVMRGDTWYLDTDGSYTWNSSDSTYTFGLATDQPVAGNW